MINDEALVQTKSLSTQLFLTTNQRNPGCLVIAGNTGTWSATRASRLVGQQGEDGWLSSCSSSSVEAKKVTRPEIKVGEMVRIRVQPIESRGSYRVNEIAWSEKVYRVVHRDLRKVPENLVPEPRGLEVQSRQRGCREVPASHLPFDALCASTSLQRLRQLRLLLTDELLIVGSAGGLAGKLCPLGARGLAVNSLFRDVVHLVLDLTQVPEPFLEAFDFRPLHLEVFDKTPLVRALGVEDLDAAALVRALGLAHPREQPQGRDRPPTASPGASLHAAAEKVISLSCCGG